MLEVVVEAVEAEVHRSLGGLGWWCAIVLRRQYDFDVTKGW